VRVTAERIGSALDDLRDLLGADRVLTGDDVRAQHGEDESWHPPAAPDAVVYPRSTEEAAAIVKACHGHGVPVIPFGAGTSLEGHVAALRGGVSVDTREMNRVLRLSVADMDVTVQAGVTRRQLDDRLRPEGVFFSVDPGAGGGGGGGGGPNGFGAWSPPARPGPRASATARCARTSSRSRWSTRAARS
jgi:D-lactate dehydrogenase (cytochrome)